MTGEVSRRRLLGGVAGVAGVAGLGGLAAGCSGHQAPPPGASSSSSVPGGKATPDAFEAQGVRRFVSRPDLQPPVITLSRRVTGPDARHIFIDAPHNGPGPGGSIILDPRGDLVWMGLDTSPARRLNFGPQMLNGKPVLTWWEGPVELHGWGDGVVVVADSSYRKIHTIHAANGLKADHHELNITPQGTVLFTIFRPRRADLSAVGGPRRGVLVSGVVQEIDIATGKLLFEWDSLNHVPISESYEPFAGGTAAEPYDYFHINSISLAPDGDLLISSRNTWTVYKVARPSGKIAWRLNGKRSNFTLGPGAKFYWQHHVRWHGAATMSIFDNGAAPVRERQSRAIVLNVDTRRRHATLRHQYFHPGQPVLAKAEGSAQLLSDGRMFVGWGTKPFFTEFTTDGRPVLEGGMSTGSASYRAFLGEWTGHPTDRPAVAARHRSGGATVYASWNGATNVAGWIVLAGKARDSAKPIAHAPRTGFETAIAVRNTGPFFAVRAHDLKGQVLQTSPMVRIS